MQHTVAHAGGRFEVEQLESRILLSTPDFGGAISLDGEFNRQGVTVVRAAVGEIGECDTYSFTARESGNQRLVLRDLNGSGLNGVLTIFDSNGDVIRDKDATGPGEREIGQFPAARGDVFFVQVGGGVGGETGDYRLRVRTEPGPIPDSVRAAAQRIDSLFDNGDGTVALLESTIAGQTHTRAFAFIARDNGSVGIITRTSAGGFTTSLDARMIVADSAGELLRIKNKRGPGEREEARIDVVQGEQYFILISGVWGDDVEGDFRLRVRAPAGDPPAIVIGGVPVEQAVPLDIVSTPAGLRVAASEGLRLTAYDLSQNPVTQLPDFEQLSPTSRITLDNVNFAQGEGDVFGIGLSDNFGLVIEGMIEIDLLTNWQFSTESNDGSRLFVDGTLVVDNDGIHGMTTVSGDINLDVGFHHIRLEYFEATGPSGLVWRIAGTNQVFNVVKPEVLSNDTLVHDVATGSELYALTAQEAGELLVQLDSTSESNGVLALYDSDGNLLLDTDEHGRAQTETLTTTLLPELLYVLTTENDGVLNIDGVSVASITTVALNNENRAAAAVDLSPDQPELVRFIANTSGVFDLSVEAGFVGRVTVYDDTGFELTRAINADADGGPDQFQLTLSAPGAFIVSFDAALGDGLNGQTTLSVTGPEGEIDGLSIADAIELTHDVPFDGTISDVGERILFSATADFIITTFGLQTFSTLSARVSIYDASGLLLNLFDVGPDSFEDFFVVRLVGFQFFVVIDGLGTTGDFQFTVT